MKTQHAARVAEEKIGKINSLVTNHQSSFFQPKADEPLAQKRSNVMNAARFIRSGLMTALAIFLVSGIAFGQGILKNGGVIRNTGSATYKEIQNYKGESHGTILNSGTLSTTKDGSGSGNFLNTDGARVDTIRNYIGGFGNGTLVVVGNITNNVAGCTIDNDSTVGLSTIKIAGTIDNTNGTFTTTRGRVWYNGGAQAVLATTYGALVADQAGAKTLADSTAVNDSLRIDNSASLAVSTFPMNLLGATNAQQNSATLSAASGTVYYAGDRDQSIIPAQYKVLTLTGATTAALTKTSAGGLSFAPSGQLKVDTNDTLYVSAGNLDLSTNTPTLINSAAIKVAGDATFHGGITNAGMFYYDGTGPQNIGAVTYANLRLGASGAKTFPNGGTVAVAGNFTIDPGTGTRTYAGSTFQFAGTSGTQAVSNLAESFNLLQFTGGAAKTLGGLTFSANRMDLSSGTGTVTNNVTTVTLANISTISMTIASGTELVNNGSLSMNGNLENDGILTNTGSIGVY
jgi:hypothetical protein